jgi:DNA uptake protein ComE-like DNA-binding protein
MTASVANEFAQINFDPNAASEDDFHRLGLSNRTTKTILNYRDKGGKFFKKEDFRKIYGLKEEDYNRLEPFIAIHSIEETPVGITKSDSKPKEDHVTESSQVDINLADSVQLISLPMIGPVLSSRIIKYRTKLGGFYSVEQLNEVYGLKPETLSAIESKIIVNSSEIKKININNVTVNDLKQHPYFKSIAVPIVSYREQHGNYQSPKDLMNIDVIDQALLDKITPYLIF